MEGKRDFEGADMELDIKVSTKNYNTEPEKKYNGESYHQALALILERII